MEGAAKTPYEADAEPSMAMSVTLMSLLLSARATGAAALSRSCNEANCGIGRCPGHASHDKATESPRDGEPISLPH